MKRTRSPVVCSGLLISLLLVGSSVSAASASSSSTHLLRPHASSGTTVPGTTCPAFPADNVWNTNISGLPVDPNSATWLASMDSSTTNLHPDYGPSGDPTNPYGIPYVVVSPTQSLVNINFMYNDESDPGPYPFSASTPIEGGSNATGDRHAIMVNPDTCNLFELWEADYSDSGSSAGSGAIWNLNSNALRKAGWTSADAAGLPILPGLVNYDEANSGVMDHAIRFTAQCTQQSYLWPARHEAGQANTSCPPMGARFRLDASFSLPASSCDAMCQTVITTMKNYGLILADNGSNWFFQGVADTRWTDNDVDQLKQIPASAFQAVDESCLMVSPNSGQALQPGTASYIENCKTPQSITFTLPTVADVGTTATLHATGGASGNPVTFTTDRASNAGVCSVSGSTVTYLATGTCILDANQAGSTTFFTAPEVKRSVTVRSGPGYDLAGSDGGVFVFPTGQPFGFYGSLPRLGVKVSNVVGIVPTDDDTGYDMAGSDGGVFVFPTGQSAGFYGSLPGLGVKASDIVGMVPTNNDTGYDLVGSDGGVFVFPTGQSAGFYGSLPGLGIKASDIVGIVATPDGGGYFMVGKDGGVFTFGDAPFLGSLPSVGDSVSDITGIASTANGLGYYVVGTNGGVYAFGDATPLGSLPGLDVKVNNIVNIVTTPAGKGYWLIGADGAVYAFGDAVNQGSLPGLGVHVSDVVGAVPTA
jgi:hypothetical protein